jgi:metallophosphoesterase (TIGR00282 family)
MNILYLGDIMAEPGLKLVEKLLPAFKREHHVDLVIAQAENVSEGKGLLPGDFLRLKMAGVDFCTGGNHSFQKEEIFPQLNDPSQPVIRPANYPVGTPGRGYKYAHTSKGDVLVISLLGHIVGKDADKPMDNPLKVVDRILESEKDTPKIATVVNFHGDFSSEKRIIGYYLDGRASVVLGDHWHVQSNDGDILPKGTAHITDVGMCGSLDSSLGVELEGLISRWRDGVANRNIIETKGRMQFNALLVDVDEATGLARSVETIRQVL